MGVATYRGFAERKEDADRYVSYQDKYRSRPKECERVTLDLIRARSDGDGRLLDVGCSTGNFVRFLHDELGGFSFVGVDPMVQAVEQAATLDRAVFHVGDFLTDGFSPSFDFVTFQTVVYGFTDDEFRIALDQAREALRPGGHAILFDLFHPFEANYEIVERSVLHPDGHTLHFRPLSLVRRLASRTGFEVAEVRKFGLEPGVLRTPYDPHDLTSYLSGGHIMRGPLAQPFCHVVLKAR